MKKGLLFTTIVCALGLGIVACNKGGNGGGGKKVPDITITNKDVLTAQWFVEDADRNVNVTIGDGSINPYDAFYDGDLVVTSDDETVVSVGNNGKIHAEGAGSALITATYKGKKSDSVDISVEVRPSMRIVTSIDTTKTDYYLRWEVGGTKYFASDEMNGFYVKPVTLDAAKMVSVTEDDAPDGDYKYVITIGDKVLGKYDGTHKNIGFVGDKVEDGGEEHDIEKALFKFNSNYTFSTKFGTTDYYLRAYNGTSTDRLAYQTKDSKSVKIYARLVEYGDPIPASAISLDKHEVTQPADTFVNLEATLTPVNSTDDIEWTSSDESVATVEDGIVSLLAPGHATITATTSSNQCTDACTITVTEALNFGTEENPLTADEAHALLANNFSDGTVTPKEVYVTGKVKAVKKTWTSSENLTIDLYKDDGETYEYKWFEVYGSNLADGVDEATIKDGAIIKAHGYAKVYNGTYELTNTKIGTSTVYPTVYFAEYTAPALTGVLVEPQSAIVDIAQGAATKQLVVSAQPAGAELGEVEWAVEPEAEGVSVDTQGLVSIAAETVEADQEKEFTVTATAGGFSDSCLLTVTRDVSPKSWQKVTSAPADGSKYKLALDRENADNNPGLWYLKDVMDGYYITTDQDADVGATVTVANVEGGYTVKLNNKYLSIANGDSGVDVKLVEEPVTLAFNDDLDIFGITVSDHFWGLGTRNDRDYTTAGRSDFTANPGNYKVYLMEYKVTPQPEPLTGIVVRPNEVELDITSGEKTQQLRVDPEPSTAELPEVEWSLVPENTKITIEDGLVTVAADAIPVDTYQSFVITATAGGFQSTCNLNVNRFGEGGPTIAQLAAGTTVTNLKARLMTIGSDNRNFFIDDGTAGILAYTSSATTGLTAGDCVTVSGTVSAYHSALQIGSATVAKSEDAAPEPTAPVELTEAYAAELLTANPTPIAGRYSLRTGVTSVTGSGYVDWDYGTVPMENGAKATAGMVAGKIYDIEGYVSGSYSSRLLFVPTSAQEVAIPAEGITFDKDTLELEVGDDYELAISALPAGAALPEGTPQWQSSDYTKVSITEGVLHAEAATDEEEVVIVTATLGGFTAQCEVTVVAVSAPDFELSTTLTTGKYVIGALGNSDSSEYYYLPKPTAAVGSNPAVVKCNGDPTKALSLEDAWDVTVDGEGHIVISYTSEATTYYLEATNKAQGIKITTSQTANSYWTLDENGLQFNDGGTRYLATYNNGSLRYYSTPLISGQSMANVFYHYIGE